MISLDAALKFLDNDNDLFRCLSRGTQGFKRSLPKESFLAQNPEVVELFREVLVAGESTDSIDANQSLDLCYKRGYLQAEISSTGQTVYVFATRIHMRYIEHLRNSAPPFPQSLFPNLQDLSFTAITSFSRTSLKSAGQGLQAGVIAKPVESHYQVELYRAFYTVLNKNVYLTSRWGGIPGHGQVGFEIKAMRWWIECVGEGDRLEEHIQRFKPGGRCYQWILSRQIDEYIILDFRKTMPREPRGMVWYPSVLLEL